LRFEEEPDPAALQNTIQRLRRELEQARAQRGADMAYAKVSPNLVDLELNVTPLQA